MGTSLMVPRIALETYRFAATDTSRLSISVVHMEPETIGKTGVTKIHSVATDGHRMIHVSWLAEKTDLYHSANLSAQGVEDFIKYATKRGKDVLFSLITDQTPKASKRFWDNRLRASNRKEADVASDESNFPDWKQVLQQPSKEGDRTTSQRFGIDLKYAYDFGKFLKDMGFGGYNAIVNYNEPDSLGPILLEPMGESEKYPGVSVECIIMPVRIP